jgi:hypothetical protein
MTVAAFHEEWFGAASCEVVATLVREVAAVDGILLEIGCWEGRSTCAIANACHPRVLHAVDTWQGTADDESGPLAAKRDIFTQWQANVAHHTQGNVEPHRMGWREFVPTITGPVAFAFIDADHSYQEVRDNIVALLPHMVSGSIMCGDDVHHPPLLKALLEVFGHGVVTSAATVWIARFP